ncbi:hypothetical protein NTG1052_560003 [Candidatus Nitrotoga sp. 1052]|nr:hypothetical protein NTG1052_560003 [Candidatus Nitrotoga sp. 1052]
MVTAWRRKNSEKVGLPAFYNEVLRAVSRVKENNKMEGVFYGPALRPNVEKKVKSVGNRGVQRAKQLVDLHGIAASKQRLTGWPGRVCFRCRLRKIPMYPVISCMA